MGKAKDQTQATIKQEIIPTETTNETKVSIADILGEATVSSLRDTLHGDYSIETIYKAADGTIVETHEFKLDHKMGSATSKVIVNHDLFNLTNYIKGIRETTELANRLRDYALYYATTLKTENGLSVLEQEGFKTIGEYAYYMFGISDKSAKQYVRIARLFYNPDGSIKYGLPKLSSSQFIPLLARVDDEENCDVHTIIEFFTPDADENSLLTGGMGANKIKSRLADYDAGIVDKHGRSLLTNEEKKELKKAKQESNANKNESAISEATSKAEKVLSPEKTIASYYIKTTVAIDNILAGDIDETKKEAWAGIQSRLAELRQEILNLAGVEE